MSLHAAIVTFKFHSSCGFHVLDHLAADGAGLTGGQVTVVTVGQVYANLGSGLHLELVHCFPCLGNIDLIVALHNSLSFCFLSEMPCPPKKAFSFRMDSFTLFFGDMTVSFRKSTQKMEVAGCKYKGFLNLQKPN
jgi:hypothetical protein